eukprot:768550-Hanusia_phi.AAC.2
MDGPPQEQTKRASPRHAANSVGGTAGREGGGRNHWSTRYVSPQANAGTQCKRRSKHVHRQAHYTIQTTAAEQSIVPTTKDEERANASQQRRDIRIPVQSDVGEACSNCKSSTVGLAR